MYMYVALHHVIPVYYYTIQAPPIEGVSSECPFTLSSVSEHYSTTSVIPVVSVSYCRRMRRGMILIYLSGDRFEKNRIVHTRI